MVLSEGEYAPAGPSWIWTALRRPGSALKVADTIEAAGAAPEQVFEKLAEKQGGAERRDISAIQLSLGQLRDTLAQLSDRQNQLQGYVSEP